MNSTTENPKNQTIVLRDRKLLELDGVSDVSGFDEATVILRTVYGPLTVEGQGLHITRLDLEKGVLSLEGNIIALVYSEENKGEKRGFFARMVK